MRPTTACPQTGKPCSACTSWSARSQVCLLGCLKTPAHDALLAAAYQSGRRAGLARLAYALNPHEADPERAQWEAGWRSGIEEHIPTRKVTA